MRILGVPLTIFASKKKETSRCQNDRKILEKMILNNGKASEKE
jgi:hypothetical protein